MPIKIEFLTGPEVGFDEPTKCRSGSCIAAAWTNTPASDGWSLVSIAHREFAHCNGWWCPECAAAFKELAAQEGIYIRSSGVRRGSAGRA